MSTTISPQTAVQAFFSGGYGAEISLSQDVLHWSVAGAGGIAVNYWIVAIIFLTTFGWIIY
ncbi:MAG: hypothetical protein AB1649_31910 [Chloroflexota bacterium]